MSAPRPSPLVPELLDSLPHDHPDARASRRDLRRLNALMGNFRWLDRTLRQQALPGMRIVELGAGDGGFGSWFLRRNPDRAALYGAVDFMPRPDSWPGDAAWTSGDLFSAGAAAVQAADVVVANLFLHHFEGGALARLGALCQRARALVFCEPARHERHVWQGRLIFPLLNRVTRHDLVVSVRAGFLDDELPCALHLGPEWKWSVSLGWLGAYRLVASRED